MQGWVKPNFDGILDKVFVLKQLLVAELLDCGLKQLPHLNYIAFHPNIRYSILKISPISCLTVLTGRLVLLLAAILYASALVTLTARGGAAGLEDVGEEEGRVLILCN